MTPCISDGACTKPPFDGRVTIGDIVLELGRQRAGLDGNRPFELRLQVLDIAIGADSDAARLLLARTEVAEAPVEQAGDPGVEAIAGEIDMLGEEPLEPRRRQAGELLKGRDQIGGDDAARAGRRREQPVPRLVEHVAAEAAVVPGEAERAEH